MTRKRQSGAGKVSLLLCVALAWAPYSWAQLHSNTAIGDSFQVKLNGVVRLDSGNKHVTSATVTLETLEGPVVAEQTVGTDGRFHFLGLQKQVYNLIASADGYQTYVQMLDLGTGSVSYFVEITLKPSGAVATPMASLPSRTDATAPKKARKECERGIRAFEQAKLREAQVHFERAISVYPCYARAQKNLALTLFQEHDLHAEGPLKKAIECDPDFVDAYLHLGRLLNAEKRFDESHKVLAEGVRRAPSSWRLYFLLAQADEGLRNDTVAEQEFLRAQSFWPAASAVHEELANLYLKEKAYDKAYVEMQAYLAADPNGVYAEKIKRVVQQLVSAGLIHTLGSQPSTAPLPKP